MRTSNLETLVCISDGETIVPGMGYVLSEGVGTTQYYNPQTGEVTPDYEQEGVVVELWPKCYSSEEGQFVVPEKDANGVGTWQWYIGSPESEENAILAQAGGASKRAMFEATVVTQAGKTYPALKVVKNVASADQLNDMEVYCKFTYGGLTVTCHTTMGVRVATGTVYDVLIQSVGEDGSGDTVIDTETESLTLTATLVRNGESVAGNGGQWTWKRRTEAGLVTVGTEAGKTLVGGTNGNQLTLWEGAVDGVEEYFAEVTVGDVTYRRGIQVTDVQDPYYIDMGREGNTVLRKTESVSYTPRVLSRGKNTVQAGWAFAFGLTNGAGEAVSAGTVTTKDGSSTLSLDGATVKQHGGLTVCVTATKES